MGIFGRLAGETIAYQRDPFPEKLRETIASIYAEIDNNDFSDNKDLLINSKSLVKMVKLIRDRFGINLCIEPLFSDLSDAAIIPSFGDYLKDYQGLEKFDLGSSIKEFFGYEGRMKLVKRLEALQKERTAMMAKIENRTGEIDFKNAKVTGYFSELPHYLIINFFECKSNGLTPFELAAVVMHEIGHAFSGMENHHKLEKYNITIKQICDEIQRGDKEKATYLFKTKFATEEEFKAYLTSDSNTVHDLTSHVAMSYIEKIRPQLIDDKYDDTSFENQADEFVNRFGYSVHLATSLHKIHQNYGMTYPRFLGTVLYFIIMIELLLLFVFLFAFSFAVGFMILVWLLSASSLKNNQLTYDPPTMRYNRVKNSIVNYLKKTDLPDVLVRDLLQQYEVVDRIISQYGEVSNHFTDAGNIIMPDSRKAAYYMELQQKLEDGLNNKLFVSYQKLKVR